MLDRNGEGIGISRKSRIGAFHCYCVDSNIGCDCCAIDKFTVCRVVGKPSGLADSWAILLVSNSDRRSKANYWQICFVLTCRYRTIIEEIVRLVSNSGLPSYRSDRINALAAAGVNPNATFIITDIYWRKCILDSHTNKISSYIFCLSLVTAGSTSTYFCVWTIWMSEFNISKTWRIVKKWYRSYLLKYWGRK